MPPGVPFGTLTLTQNERFSPAGTSTPPVGNGSNGSGHNPGAEVLSEISFMSRYVTCRTSKADAGIFAPLLDTKSSRANTFTPRTSRAPAFMTSCTASASFAAAETDKPLVRRDGTLRHGAIRISSSAPQSVNPFVQTSILSPQSSL